MRVLAKKAGSFAESEIDGEIVLMSLGNGDFFSLTGPAAEAWRLIDGTRDRRELVEYLGEQFQAEDDVVATDVEDFIASLFKAGFLVED